MGGMVYGRTVNGTTTEIAADSNDNLNVNLGTLVSGENQTDNRMMTEERYTFRHITAVGTAVVKSTAGLLAKVIVGKAGGTAAQLGVWNSTGAHGTVSLINCTAVRVVDLYADCTTAIYRSFTGSGSPSITLLFK